MATAASESKSLFNVTSRFREAIELINTIPPKKFPLLLARITSKLHSKSEAVFSAEEEQQLQLLFGQNAANLETVLEVCSYIFEQAVYEDIAADRLRAELVSAGVKEAQADAFGRVWTGEGPSLVEACRSKPLGTPMVLDTIKWQMNLALAHTGLSRSKDTAALFELGLKSADESSETEHVKIQFSHDELYNFFASIETIQQQLDSLS